MADDSADDEAAAPLGWWSISGTALLGALRAVAAGDDPDLVYAELYANSDSGTVDPSADDGQ